MALHFYIRMAKAKKIDKDYTLSDSSVNVYGFRLLTSGYLIEEYLRNPIGYYMHNREEGVVLKWDDLRIEGDKVVAKPVINLSNERGEQTVDEVENGFLNGASVGHIVALEWSEDPKDMLPGQTGPTITKWYNREASLCDVPGNMNALALYDKDGNTINLSDFKIQKQTLIMKDIKLTAAQLAKLNLTDTATEADINTKIENLVAEAGKVPQLTQDLAAANTAKKTAEDALAAEKEKNVKADVAGQLDAALSAKKITAEQKTLFEKQYEGKPEDLKALLATMKPYTSVVENLSTTVEGNPELKALMSKTGKELWASGEIDKLKTLSEEAYKIKYKEAFEEDAPAD
jgi:hypothetical protein